MAVVKSSPKTPAAHLSPSPVLRRALDLSDPWKRIVRHPAEVAHRFAFPTILFLISFSVFFFARGVALSGSLDLSYITWDGNWYRSIAETGYLTDGNRHVQQNVAFFPLYPLAVRAAHRLTGFAVPTSMLLVSALSTWAALLFLYTVFTFHFEAWVGRTALTLLALSPYSVFFYSGYSEPLFLLLIAAFFYFLTVRNTVLPAVAAVALASAVRPYGCLLAVVLGVELLRRHHEVYGFRFSLDSLPLRQLILWTPFCFAGLIAHTLWLGYQFNEPLAFSHALAAWSASEEPARLMHLLLFLHLPRAVMLGLQQPMWAGPFLTGILLFLAAPLLALRWRNAMPLSFTFFLLMMFLFLHASSHHGAERMVNMGRHLIVVFPLILGIVLALHPDQVRRYFQFFLPDGDSSLCGCSRALCALPLLIVIALSVYLYARNTMLYYQDFFVS